MTTATPFSQLLERRILLVTGKGGVGKTSVSAALARAAAAAGKRVLAAEIASDEAAPSPLATALGAAASDDEPIDVAPSIRAVRIAPSRGHQDFLRDTMPMRFLADAAMKSAAIRRFLSAAPTLAEMGILYRLLYLSRAKHRSGGHEHETIVVDLPATGHALALTQLPEAMLKVIPGGPIVAAVKDGLAMVTDPKQTATVIVTLPETLPVSESLELVRNLERHDLPVVAMVLNRAPDDPFDAAERAYLDGWLVSQKDVLGLRSLGRIDRAAKARARIAATFKGHLFQLPELEDDDTLAIRLSLGFATMPIAEAGA